MDCERVMALCAHENITKYYKKIATIKVNQEMIEASKHTKCDLKLKFSHHGSGEDFAQEDDIAPTFATKVSNDVVEDMTSFHFLTYTIIVYSCLIGNGVRCC